MAAAVRLPSVVGAAATGPARHDPADGAQLHRSNRPSAGTLTLVTLECKPVDIAMSVSEVNAAVYWPPVLRPRDQHAMYE